MDEKQFHLPDQENYFLSGHALGKLVRRADGNAALMYLYMLKGGGKFSVAGAMETLQLTEREVYDAVGVLATLGLVAGSGAKIRQPEQEAPQVEELPQYSAAELEREMKSDGTFASLVKEVGSMLNKILTTPDLNTLMGIHHHLGLPPEVIYQLVSHLTAEHQEKYGPGKYPTLRGVEKVAYQWAKNDIVTLDAAMDYIRRRQEQKQLIGQIKTVMDLKKDKLTPSQEKYIYAWIDMGFDVEVIAMAYDRTVMNTGELKWNYMNKILSNWHKDDLLTAEAVEAKDSRSASRPTLGQKDSPMPDRQEIERKKRLLDQMNGK